MVRFDGSARFLEGPAKPLQAPPQLGLEAALGRLVEAPAAQLLGHQGLPGEAAGLVVGVGVALPAAQLRGAGVVGVADLVRRDLRSLATNSRLAAEIPA